MCRFCYSVELNQRISSFSEHDAILYTPQIRPIAGLYCRLISDKPKKLLSSVSEYWSILPITAIVMIILYAGQYNLPFLMAQCDKTLHHMSSKEMYWEEICNVWASYPQYVYLQYPFQGNLSDTIDFIQPNKECPESWRDYYLASCKKIRWLQSRTSNLKEMKSFLPLFRRLNNQKFGMARKFSSNEIYIVSSHDCIDYNILEVLISKGKITVENQLDSNVLLTIRSYDDDNSVKRDMTLKTSTSMNSGNSTNLDSSTVWIASLQFISSNAQESFISYMHIAITIIKLEDYIIVGDGIYRYLTMPTPSFSMPYEFYYYG